MGVAHEESGRLGWVSASQRGNASAGQPERALGEDLNLQDLRVGVALGLKHFCMHRLAVDRKLLQGWGPRPPTHSC